MIKEDISEFKVDAFIGYLADNLVKDTETNPSLDMDELSYSSLYKRLVALSVMEATKDNILTLAVISTIIFITSSSGTADKDFSLGMITLYAFLKELEEEFTIEQVNQMLIKRYQFLVHNCTLNKLSVVVHTYDTLVGKLDTKPTKLN